jgi:hypothetical protein
MSGALDEFVAAGPPGQRDGLRVLLFLARRRRGRALLARIGLALQAADSVALMARYDDPALARSLGWDADAVAGRGRELRRAEGRP